LNVERNKLYCRAQAHPLFNPAPTGAPDVRVAATRRHEARASSAETLSLLQDRHARMLLSCIWTRALPFSAPDLGLPFDLRSWDRLHRPIWLFDPHRLRGLYANAPAIELWGADSLEELLARDFSQLSPSVLSRLSRLAQATAEGETVSERWSFYPRGQPVTVQAIISSLPLDGGGVALMFEAEPVAVEKGELRAVEALRHTSSLISLFDSQGHATFANPAAFAAYGKGDQDFAERFVDPAYGQTTLADVLAGKIMAELTAVRTIEGERWHYLDARRVNDPVTGQVSVLLSERDVTAQVEAEQNLRSAQERAELAEAKQRFLANISHELRTPLNSVIGFAGLLEASNLDAAQSGHLRRISQSGEALLKVINDIIDLAEIDGGTISLELAPFDIGELCHQALKGVQADAAAKDLALTLDLRGAARDTLVGDARKFSTVISSFLTNAVKFTDQGEVVLSVSTLEIDGREVRLEIAVADTGPGLDLASRDRLFRRFSQGDDSIRKRVSGAGLGLAIAKELVTLMGGEIGVDSAPGLGARFWVQVTLPFAEALEPAVEETAEEAEEDRPLVILYADDHENNRVLVQALLESQGHRCDTVDDGAQAVLAVRDCAYDLVLMDIQMPVLDGVGATLEIRAAEGAGRRLPIVALTANTLSEQREAYAAAGLDDCIAKPVNVAELFAKVGQWACPAPIEASVAQLSA